MYMYTHVCTHVLTYNACDVYTYAAAVFQLGNHQAPIVSITPISTSSSPSHGGGGGSSQGSEGDVLDVSGGQEDVRDISGGLSFQLATLDR